MRARWILAAAFASLVFGLAGQAMSQGVELNDRWRFHRGDTAGAEQPSFDDHGWRAVSVPHDWSIEDRPGQSHPFDKDAPGAASIAYTECGVGWYRRTLELPRDTASRTVLLRFEAVYMDAEVWVNGASVGRHAFGYTPFTLDVSDKVRPGANTVAVRVNNQQPSSRWYSGSGILRPVHLEVLDKVHIDPQRPTITTPKVAITEAEVRARTVVVNALSRPVQVRLISTVVDARGREVRRAEETRAAAANATIEVEQAMTLDWPALWSPETPNLYALVQELKVDGRSADRRTTRFGVRSVTFDAEHGLRVNGRRVLLRGGAIHADNYMLGGAALPRADARKLELMKAAGYVELKVDGAYALPK